MSNALNTSIGLRATNLEGMKNMLNLSSSIRASTNGNSRLQGIRWRRNFWAGSRGEYTGTATAEKGASLSGLAYLVTGDGGDFEELGLTQKAVEIGQIVQIAPLLRKLELKIRAKVVEATKTFQAAGFPASATISVDSKSPAARVNQYFSRNNLECDCMVAAISVLEKGLLDVIGSNQFNRLGRAGEFHEVKITALQDSAENMRLGDRGIFPNYEDWRNYANGEEWAWNGENVIKVGSDLFWGYAGEPQYTAKSKNEWEAKLRQEFNDWEKFKQSGEPPRQQRIPGMAQAINVLFVDVAAVAMEIFDLRRKGFR